MGSECQEIRSQSVLEEWGVEIQSMAGVVRVGQGQGMFPGGGWA